MKYIHSGNIKNLLSIIIFNNSVNIIDKILGNGLVVFIGLLGLALAYIFL